MPKLRGGTPELGIEIGRWHGVRRDDIGYVRNVAVESWRMLAILSWDVNMYSKGEGEDEEVNG